MGSKLNDAVADVHIILGGYSYGSLIASHLPTICMEFFKETPDDTTFQVICKITKKIATCSTEKSQSRIQSLTLRDSSLTGDKTRPTKITKPTISYLFVSPLSPPVSIFVAVVSKVSLDVDFDETSRQIPLKQRINSVRISHWAFMKTWHLHFSQ